MIEIKNLSKTYKIKEKTGLFSSEVKEVEAVKNLSIKIPRNKITGLLGINGAGKTSTIKMLSTLIEPTEGEILFDGENYEKNIKGIKSKINMIAGGERMIYWRLTARENLMYFGQMYGIPKSDLVKRIDYLLEKVGLIEKSNVPVESFSKGMKQRLQIARGLINNPDFIFLDEPTLGLDVQIAKEMRDFFKEMIKDSNKGILLTTHYMHEVEELCDYIYILHKGKLIHEGTPQEISKLHGNGEKDSLEQAIIALSNKLSEKNKKGVNI